MNNIKTFIFNILTGAVLLSCTMVSGQQRAMQTQFMYNKQQYNPGYVGSFASPTLTAIYRDQWIGFEGAPNIQALSYTQAFLGDHLGIGMNLNRHAVGITKNITIGAPVFAYHIFLPRGELGIGLQPTLQIFRQNWNDQRLVTPQPGVPDVSIPTENGKKTIVNLDFGVYYTGPKWYLGFAVQDISDANIDFSDYGSDISKQFRHLNAMSGITFQVGEQVEITPQFLIKYVKNAPPDADVNVSAAFMKKFHTGVTYRIGGDKNNTGESIDVLAGVQATKNLFLMLSYDIGLTRLSKYSNGSVEATVRWWFNPPEGDQVVDPGRPDANFQKY